MADVLKDFLRLYGLTPKINTRKVFDAWNEASGASQFTTKLFFRGGILYVTVSSSVVRSQLSFQRQAILEKMNDLLLSDTLFDPGDKSTGSINEIRIK